MSTLLLSLLHSLRFHDRLTRLAVWMTEAAPEVTPNGRPYKRVVGIAIYDGRLNTNGVLWVCSERGPSRALRTSSQIDINERSE